MGRLNRFLRKNPSIIKKIIYNIVPYGLRYGGRTYNELLRMLHDSQYWSPEKMEAYQNTQLRLLITRAYECVPYYRHVFKRLNLTPDDVVCKEDLEKLPILTREILKSNKAFATDVDMMHESQKKNRLTSISTSGSSGTPLSFYADKTYYEREAAFIERAYKSHGSTLYYGKSIWLRRFVAAYDDAEHLYYKDHEQQRLYVNPFHISRRTVQGYVETMNKYKAPVLVAYPSSIYSFALLLEKTKLKLEHVKAIQVSSEMCPDEWRDKIKEVTGIPVFDHYGQQEHVALFHRCSGGIYHENPEYGITELVDGKIISTSFNNYMTPFIRYDTGDLAVEGSGRTFCAFCCTTLPQTIKKIEGRQDDIIVTPDGTMIPPINFYTMMYKIAGVEMFKIIQYADDKVAVWILATSLKMYSGASRVVKREMQKRLGNSVEIKVARASEHFTRDSTTGKLKCVIVDKENKYVM